MIKENEYKEYSTQKVNTYKESWNKDFFHGVNLIDLWEIFFVGVGMFAFLYLSLRFKVAFIIILVLSYWFRIKLIEEKIITAKQFLVLGAKFINENFRGRGVTEGGAEPHYKGHRRGFKDYINFLETQRNHLVARMIILNLFALVLLEIIGIK